MISKIKLASFGKFNLVNKNRRQSKKLISGYFIFIDSMKLFNTSFLSFGYFCFAKNSPMRNLSNPPTTRRNSPYSFIDLIIKEFFNVS